MMNFVVPRRVALGLLIAVSSVRGQWIESTWDGSGVPGSFFGALAWADGAHWSTSPAAPNGSQYHAILTSGAVVAQGQRVGALTFTGGQLGDYGIPPNILGYTLDVVGPAIISGRIINQRVFLLGGLSLGSLSNSTVLEAGARIGVAAGTTTTLRGDFSLHDQSVLGFGSNIVVQSPVSITGSSGSFEMNPSPWMTLNGTSFFSSGSIRFRGGNIESQDGVFQASYLQSGSETVIDTGFRLSGNTSILLSGYRAGQSAVPITQSLIGGPLSIEGTGVNFPALSVAANFFAVTLSQSASIHTTQAICNLNGNVIVRSGSLLQCDGRFVIYETLLLAGGEVRAQTLGGQMRVLSGSGTLTGNASFPRPFPTEVTQVRPSALSANDAEMIAGVGFGTLRLQGNATFSDALFDLDVGLSGSDRLADLVSISGQALLQTSRIRLRVDGALAVGDEFTIVTAAGGLTIEGLTLETVAGTNYLFEMRLSGTELHVVVVGIVPEPSVWALMGSAAALGWWSLRQRRSRPA